MQIDDFLELAKKRRSIRRLQPDPVPDELIGKILETARWAMSGGNSQPWQFIVIKDKEILSKMADVYVKYYRMQALVEMTRLPEYAHPSRNPPSDVLWRYAPVVIAVLGDIRVLQASTINNRVYEERTFDHNMANAVMMIHLAAAASGLGSQWVSLDPPKKELMKQILGIPPELILFSLVPIGYPDQQPAAFRRELDEMVHYDTYDMSKHRSQEDIQEFVRYLRNQESKLKRFLVI